MRRHGPALRRRCARIVGATEADDAYQRALMQALVGLRRHDGRPLELVRWLHRVTHNAAVDVLRAAGPVTQELDDAHTGVPQPPDVAALRAELEATVTAVAALPARQRRALVAHAVEGRSWAQIAGELDVAEPAVGQLLVRARRTLRAGLGAVVVPFFGLRARLARAATALPTAPLRAGAAALAVATAGVGGQALMHEDGATARGAVRAARVGRPLAAPPTQRATVKAAPDPRPRPSRAPAASRRVVGRHRPAVPAGPRRTPIHRAAATPPVAVSAPAHPVVHHNVAAPSAVHVPPSRPAPVAAHPPATVAAAPPAPAAVALPVTQPAPAPPAPATVPPAPAPVPAPPSVGRISAYTQTAGFGGPLEVQPAAGGPGTVAYLGELTVLRCLQVHGGLLVAAAPCTPAAIVPGRELGRADHAVNNTSSDVWTAVDVLVPV